MILHWPINILYFHKMLNIYLIMFPIMFVPYLLNYVMFAIMFLLYIFRVVFANYVASHSTTKVHSTCTWLASISKFVILVICATRLFLNLEVFGDIRRQFIKTISNLCVVPIKSTTAGMAYKCNRVVDNFWINWKAMFVEWEMLPIWPNQSPCGTTWTLDIWTNYIWKLSQNYVTQTKL